MDLFDLLEYYIKTYAAGRLVLLGTCAATTKGLVDLIKKYWPHLQGNVIQTIALGIALVVSFIAFLSAGAFHPVIWPDVGAYFAVAGLTWAGSIGINEVFKNRNRGESDSLKEKVT